jgi:hypothetical protein
MGEELFLAFGLPVEKSEPLLPVSVQPFPGRK